MQRSSVIRLSSARAMASSPGRNRLARNAASNVIQMLVGSLLLFALYRYINEALGVAQLGVWSVVVASVSVSRLTDFGLSAGVTRFVARDQGRDDQSAALTVIDTATIALAVVVGAFLPVFYWLVGIALPHFFQGEHLGQARGILPFALASLWLSIVASVFQGGLEGCQRMGLRTALMLTSQLLLLLLSIWWVPRYGLTGLAYAQVAQGIWLLFGGRLVLQSVMPGIRWFRWRWRSAVLREMLGYGANLQASTLFILLFDPAAKALMARFGGPSAAGYFEMANQVVLRVRSLIVAANQAVVPHVAGWVDPDASEIAAFHRQNIRMLVLVTLPLMGLLATAGPFASWVLAGRYQPEFALNLVVLSLAWGCNVLGSPAYFINQGTGHVGTNTLAHAITGGTSTALGLLLGWRFGAVGVLVGYAAGLMAGTAWLLRAFRRRYGASLQGVPGLREHVWLFLASLLAAAWSGCMLLHPELARLDIAAVGLVVASIMMCGVIWSHGVRKEVQRRVAWLGAAR